MELILGDTSKVTNGSEKLWGASLERPEADIFFDEVRVVQASMQEAAGLKLLVEHEGEKGKLFTKPYKFEGLVDNFDGTQTKKWHKAELHTDRKQPGKIFLAIHALPSINGKAKSRHDMQDFVITETGTVNRRNDLSNSGMRSEIANDTDYDYNIVKQALQRVTEGVQNDIRNKQNDIINERYWRKERNRTIRNRSIGATAALAVIGGVTYGIGAWVDAGITQPNARAQEARDQYDQTSHDLSGEPIIVGSHSFVIIPESEFNDIPPYGGDDTNLENPRTVNVDNGCAVLPGAYESGAELIIALPENSIYSFSEYTASLAGDEVTLCLTKAIVKQSGKSDDDFKIAVQER